jgi:hypothetical protein
LRQARVPSQFGRCCGVDEIAAEAITELFGMLAIAEVPKANMDRNWPYQVAPPTYRCLGHNYLTIQLFCEGLSLSPRTHSFRRNHLDTTVFCFVTPP